MSIKKMALKSDQERLHTLIKDTLTLLCKNGLSYKSQFSVEALIGITLDQQDVFLINIKELIEANTVSQESLESDNQEDVSIEDMTAPKRKRSRRNMKRKYNENVEASADEVFSGGYTSDEPPVSVKFIHEDDQAFGQGLLDNTQEIETMKHNVDDSGGGVLYITPQVVMSGMLKQEEGVICIKKEMVDGSDSMTVSDGGYYQGMQEQTGSSALMGEDGGMYDASQSQQPGVSQQAAVAEPNTSAPPIGMGILPSGYQCPVCGRVLKSKSNLRVHLNLHEDKFNYHCPECNKGFSARSALEGHMSWHTGVKEFKCQICHKEFRYKNHMKQHFREKHEGLAT